MAPAEDIEQGFMTEAEFNRVQVINGFHVNISLGEEHNVEFKVAEDVLKNVEAIRRGDELVIRVKNQAWIHQDFSDISLEADVTMPALIELKLNHGSWVTVTGSGDDVIINAKAGSQADLTNFAIENADITVSDGSQVDLNVSGRLDAVVEGGSKVTYSGNPDLGDIDVSDDSTFEKK